MIDPINEVLDEGNCGRVTDLGEEACECVRKHRVCLSPPRHILVKSARLRSGTSYKAGSTPAHEFEACQLVSSNREPPLSHCRFVESTMYIALQPVQYKYHS